MARIAGVDIPNEKRIEIALQYIYGVGPHVAKKVLKELAINPGGAEGSLKGVACKDPVFGLPAWWILEAQVLTVRGTVRGDCEASTKVEITATGRVFGNIAARAIVVAEGATFRGASKMAQPDASKPEASRSETASGPAPGAVATRSSQDTTSSPSAS